MNKNHAFYNWFQKVISVFIDIFFVIVPVVSLAVFTTPFEGVVKYVVFALLCVVYALTIYFLKDKIKELIRKLINRIDRLDEKKMLLILFITMIVLKIIYSIFFGFDATQDGDIQIYNDIADHILETGELHSDAISHLFGIGIHYAFFKYLHIPLHIGFFIVVLLAVLINFISFKELIGKNKAFLLSFIYVLMPSTSMMSYCPTHEVLVFLYVSVFLFVFNRMMNTESFKYSCIYLILGCVFTILTCLVNPGGYIMVIVVLLNILLTNAEKVKKIMAIILIVISLLGNRGLEKVLQVREWETSMNTYTILIHGTNPDSLGEQVDGYPHKLMRHYIHANTLDFSKEGYIDAAQHVLLNQYRYLLTHPVTLIRLIANKMFILWSGVHYPVELAHVYEAIDGIPYYALLVINTFIYLFVITMGIVYKKDRKDILAVSNYKLELLGIIALTMLCIVVNKYSLYATMFLYFVSFYRMEIEDEQ